MGCHGYMNIVDMGISYIFGSTRLCNLIMNRRKLDMWQIFPIHIWNIVWLWYLRTFPCELLFFGTMVPKAKNTAVLVLIPGFVDRSWSRTVDSLQVSTSVIHTYPHQCLVPRPLICGPVSVCGESRVGWLNRHLAQICGKLEKLHS